MIPIKKQICGININKLISNNIIMEEIQLESKHLIKDLGEL